MIIYIIYRVCVFVLIVLSNYVDKYINKCFLYIYFLWFLSNFLSLKELLKGWGCCSFQGKGVGAVWGGGCRAEGGIGGDGYGGVQGRGSDWG